MSNDEVKEHIKKQLSLKLGEFFLNQLQQFIAIEQENDNLSVTIKIGEKNASN